MISYYFINDESRIESADSAECAAWIHLENPDEREMQATAEKFGFPLDYLHTSLDPDEVSRSEKLSRETLEDHALILLLYPIATENPGSYYNRSIAIILLPGKIVTCLHNNPEFINDILKNDFEIISEVKRISSIIIEIVWHIARGFVLASREVQAQMDKIHAKLRGSTKSDHLLQLADLDKSIIFLNTAISENQPILEEMASAQFIAIDDMEKAWLHDALVENHQADRMADQTKQMLKQMDTTFASIIQNNLNDIVKILTSVTIIITIPTIISGFWGMNVGLPLFDHPNAFAYMLMLTLALMVLAVFLLKRKDLL